MPDFRAVPEGRPGGQWTISPEGEVMSPAEPERGQAPGFSMIARAHRLLPEEPSGANDHSGELDRKRQADQGEYRIGVNWYELGPTR